MFNIHLWEQISAITESDEKPEVGTNIKVTATDICNDFKKEKK